MEKLKERAAGCSLFDFHKSGECALFDFPLVEHCLVKAASVNANIQTHTKPHRAAGSCHDRPDSTDANIQTNGGPDA
jgi:hypothetical protein